MILRDLIEEIEGARLEGPGEVEIKDLAVDSRKVEDGTLFIAVRGYEVDGHAYIDEAIDRGAAAVVTEMSVKAGVPVVVVTDSRSAEPVLSRKFFNAPDSRMSITGITGTNGKTSTAFLLQSILDGSKGPAGIVGTVGYGVGTKLKTAEHTTPGAVSLFRILSDFEADGCSSAVMEVSSHAAVQRRVEGIEFDAGIFTNITRDHLDYHETFENYIEAKESFIRSLSATGRTKGNGTLIYNADDEKVREVASRFKGPVLSFGTMNEADVRAEDIKADLDGTAFTLVTPSGKTRIELGLLGRFSIFNALAAAGAAEVFSIRLEDIREGLEQVRSVPGRFQVIRGGNGRVVVVDYAHTPDAMENLLNFCRELEPSRLVTVFGCGGDRDRGKRSEMGRIASTLSDIVYVTNDNPRTEDPGSILDEIFEGIEDGVEKVSRIEDRSEAIRNAIYSSGKGDLVVIAGKGHEDYQILGKKKIHFSDTEQAEKTLHDLEV